VLVSRRKTSSRRVGDRSKTFNQHSKIPSSKGTDMQLTTKKVSKVFMMGLLAVGLSATAASPEDITIRLPPSASVSRKTVRYQCDAQGPKIGVPPGPFSVEYINGGGNSLVVVPISGKPLIFSNVISASGARYAAQQFIWWEAQGVVTLYSDSLTGKLQSACRPVPAE
jgi:membrane-bound inhibitor of C-type lysozyme